MKSCAASLAKRCRSIGRKILHGRSTSISGSAYRKSKIRAWQRCTPLKPASRPSRDNFMTILSRPPLVRAQPIVSFGGIGSASALAKFYSMLANDGKADGQTFFSEQTLEWMRTTLSDGVDRVFQIPTAFSAGFMKDPRETARRIFGPSGTSFGHPGAGGSHAFADPEKKIAFAYVMNQMEQSLLPNEKSLRLVDAIYG